MTLRINHNIAAINSHRNLVRNDANLGRTLEHLSSGMKINRASDGPAALVISEQMRAQVAGLTQAIMNSEAGVAMVQTAEANLQEVNSILVNMRQLAIHAANDGANDDVMLAADQAEVTNSIDSIDRIASTSQFGLKHLLDGTLGVNGIAVGDKLDFVNATTATESSGVSGYEVKVLRNATRSTLESKPLTREMIDMGEVITVTESGRTIQLTTEIGDTYANIENKLNAEMERIGVNTTVYFDPEGRLNITHNDFGSESAFTATSSTAGFLSELANTPIWIQNGMDIHGMIGGEMAIGEGQLLKGDVGTPTEGLVVRYTGTADPLNPKVGEVAVESNALIFQVGGNAGQITKVLLPDTHSHALGQEVDNLSGFKSIRDLDMMNNQGAQDALLLIDKAIDQITGVRAELGATQKHTLESNITSLGIARENLLNADSVIRDTDMAGEMSDFTKYQIMTQAATAMLAQANQSPNNVLSLLK